VLVGIRCGGYGESGGDEGREACLEVVELL
jgi:hypothetical protein